ncbi:methyltransferase domain-containing protein [Geminicoccaceae bacterium 1502E]|nr:methyltransferase domain-containing protein [Geminicoccaceae bacterium 1502E]
MRPEVEELQAFYGSREGQLARRLVHARLRALWPDLRGARVLGIGFAGPFLAAFEGAERTLAVMPPSQGALAWPPGSPSRTVLARDDELPLPDGSADRVLLAHALECSEDSSRLLREVWRVLADGGRLIALVPNRSGLWCWSERTPFGQGQPFSQHQLELALQRQLFEPVASARALYLPPVRSRLLQRGAIAVERLGLRLAPGLGGVLLVEAEKRIYLATPLRLRQPRTRRRYVPIAEGIAVQGAAAARCGHPVERPRPAGAPANLPKDRLRPQSLARST